MEKEKLDIKTKFAIVSAVVAFLIGWGLTVAGFLLPPRGEVHDSVLWILGQALVYAASVFGVGMYISSEMTKLRTENRNYIERALEKEKEEVAHED
jgi:Na+/melibiose symporter-like transporter